MNQRKIASTEKDNFDATPFGQQLILMVNALVEDLPSHIADVV